MQFGHLLQRWPNQNPQPPSEDPIKPFTSWKPFKEDDWFRPKLDDEQPCKDVQGDFLLGTCLGTNPSRVATLPGNQEGREPKAELLFGTKREEDMTDFFSQPKVDPFANNQLTEEDFKLALNLIEDTKFDEDEGVCYFAVSDSYGIWHRFVEWRPVACCCESTPHHSLHQSELLSLRKQKPAPGHRPSGGTNNIWTVYVLQRQRLPTTPLKLLLKPRVLRLFFRNFSRKEISGNLIRYSALTLSNCSRHTPMIGQEHTVQGAGREMELLSRRYLPVCEIPCCFLCSSVSRRTRASCLQTTGNGARNPVNQHPAIS